MNPKPSNSSSRPDTLRGVFLVGAGVVGRAIARAHIESEVSVHILDQDEDSLRDAIDSLELSDQRWRVSSITHIGELPGIEIISRLNDPPTNPTIVIESIAEKLLVKQAFFSQAEQWFAEDAIFCSNTSTLRINSIAGILEKPQRFCGMHFFMPVHERPAVEIVRAAATADSTIENCVAHSKRIHKQALVVGDGPGFVVNRLLSPYLNQAMWLLGRGVSAERIERAALQYGMPISPLELIDWIGTRTMFDAGRVYWQAFPSRIDPSPILPAMIKKKQAGRGGGSGFYDYQDGVRSKTLTPLALELCEKYRTQEIEIDDRELMLLLSVPMWIEAALAFRDGIVDSLDQFDLAMRGGLGFDPKRSWLESFDQLGNRLLAEVIDRWSPCNQSIAAPAELRKAIQSNSPTDSIVRYATVS